MPTYKLEARTTEQGTLMPEWICARDNVQEIREHRKHKRDNVQEIKEHEGDIELMQEKMCRRTGNMKER